MTLTAYEKVHNSWLTGFESFFVHQLIKEYGRLFALTGSVGAKIPPSPTQLRDIKQPAYVPAIRERHIWTPLAYETPLANKGAVSTSA